ncbi:transcription initiation factor TFIID subunit 12 isoform X4 [Zea mays]|uniref:Transcription initiation factor TFIID subunit 12 n=1 Tax=Zea mays TaxID=4577 RepID=A0A1D6N6Q9_MAIZE|nr:transcription initiation factor TFIID subunit 12 isoform X4 [Zea mays]ONM36282.1 Transcription initiation factor TFIID subunit 12 [Zea mays]|eukprot:XP_020406007.1 transcription initiation factor TFIID subunit 12 isoform X4 [Zea mays]
MDAPPPSQPDDAAPAPSSTLASAPSPAPTSNPPTSAAAAAPAPDSAIANPNPNLGTVANPAQTLEAPGPSSAAARPPPPRMRTPYTHLAAPITMSSSSSAATAAASSASVPAASSSAPPIPRGGVVLGVPAPRSAQTPAGYTGFVPPPPLAHQFGSMHRGPDQPPPSSSQRPPSQSLMRPVTVSSPSLASQQTPQSSSSTFRPQQRPQVSQPRPQQSQLVTPPQQNTILTQQQQQQKQQQSASHQNQQIAAPKNQPQLSQHPTARTPISMTPKPDLPAIQNVAVLQSVDTAATDANASETGTRLLTKRSIHELVAQIDPNEKLDPEVEDVLIDIAEDFVESVTTFACSLAKHRKSSTLEAKDVLLHAERSWNITLPGFSGDEIKLYKKQHINDIHRERLALIKKSMATDTRNSAAQAAANQKNQTPKPPAPASP